MGSVILLKTRPALNSRYLTLFLASPVGQERVIALSGSTAQQAIYLRDTRTLLVPVPSLAEQEEIVRRTDALLHIVDLVGRTLKTARIFAEKLPQSILAKAFRGELVPTEAELARREGREYEPASVLLERIKAERKAVEDFSSVRRKRRAAAAEAR